MIISPGGCQHIGDRSYQQDVFGFSDKDDLDFVAHGGVLAVVADGMGGKANGGESSEVAVSIFLQSYMAKQANETVQNALLVALQEASSAVLGLANEVGEENVGTTLVAAVIHGSTLNWVAVGDSRLYLTRNGKLTQLTVDHVFANELDRDAANGKISREEAANHPERPALTSYLGLNPLELIDKNPGPFFLLPKDQLLLCSDGLYTALESKEVTALYANNPQKTAEGLVARVLGKKRLGQDNLTVAVLGC